MTCSQVFALWLHIKFDWFSPVRQSIPFEEFVNDAAGVMFRKILTHSCDHDSKSDPTKIATVDRIDASSHSPISDNF